MKVSCIAASESLGFLALFYVFCLCHRGTKTRRWEQDSCPYFGLATKAPRDFLWVLFSYIPESFSLGAFFLYTGVSRLPQLSFRGAVGCPVFIERNHALGKRAAELKRLRPFAVGQKGKAMRKREMTIAGIPLQPIRRGKPAVIREANGCRQTTPVLWVDQLSSTEVPVGGPAILHGSHL